MKKFLMAVAAVSTLAMAAPAAQAAVTLNTINSADLNLNGTEDFGATRTITNGSFSDVFTFTLDAKSVSSTTVGTIILFGRDIDFSAIDLDGTAFSQTGFDPSGENWELSGVVLGAGPHTITTHYSVSGLTATPPVRGATYTGSLNIEAVPEPGTWGLMIMGFGGMGAVLRRRRQVLAVA